MKRKIMILITFIMLLTAMAVPVYAAESAGAQSSPVKGIVIALVIGVIVALIVVFNIKGKYKPVQTKRTASNYLVKGSFHVTGLSDNFVRRDTSQRALQNNSSQGK